jgi:UDP-N-acetylglucosamine 2-epimerase (non-hydrolysing)
MMKLLHVVGARPNFPKLAPVFRAAAAVGMAQRIVHTGQHYDDGLSCSFFRQLCIPEPDINLSVGSGTHAEQTARVMERIEPVLLTERPDWVMVYGDVNSTVAAALVASKLGVHLAHVEAGLRSHDRTMPEEINRIVTDRLADMLLTPSRDADAALRAEGEPEDEIVFVGNVMVDTLVHSLPAARETCFAERMGVGRSAVIVTLHRPSNVDEPERLRALAQALREIAREYQVIFPAHPRTAARLSAIGANLGQVRLLEPLGYLEMLCLMEHAHAVITDSGGVQEETTALGVPCLTVRKNTERPITLTHGTNRLAPNPAELPELVPTLQRTLKPRRPEGWDGRAGERVTQALLDNHRTK